MLFLFYIIISLLFALIYSDSYSDNVMKTKDFMLMENKAKTFACSLLASSNLLSKKREKQIREYLKKNKYDTSQQKIIEFKTVVCYNNIYIDKANSILTSLSDGKFEFIDDKSNSKFFDFDSKSDFNTLTKDLEYTNKIMKDLEEEEKNLHEKRKDDQSLDNELKDIEKKLIKNPRYVKGNRKRDDNFNIDDISYKKRKINSNKNSQKFKDDINDSINNNNKKREFNIKEIIKNPELLTEYMGIKTAIGFIIIMIILSIYDAKNQKRMKEEEEKKKMEQNNNKDNKDNKDMNDKDINNVKDNINKEKKE